jgi:hypothetical protein
MAADAFVCLLPGRSKDEATEWTSVHDLLFEGKIDATTGRRTSLFSNTPVILTFDSLAAAKLDDVEKLDKVKLSVDLRGRHLKGGRAVWLRLQKSRL